jgi:hypothetical protein
MSIGMSIITKNKNYLLLRFLFAMVALASTSALASEHDIVIDIDGSLIQKIPSNQARNYDTSTLIKVGYGTYKVADNAVEMLTRLSANPDNKIYFLSHASASETSQILAAISKMKPTNPDLTSLAAKVFSAESLSSFDAGGKPDDEYLPKTKQLDLKKVNSDLSHVVLVTDNSRATVPGQENNIYYYQHPYYEFKSFEDSKTEADSFKKANAKKFSEEEKFFPTSEKEWKRHQDRIAAIYGTLLSGIEKSDQDPQKSLSDAVNDAAQASSVEDRIEAGLNRIQTHLEWDIQGGAVKGCREISDKTKQPIRSAHNEECAATLPVKYKWLGNKNNECNAFTDKDIAIGPVDSSLCIKNLGARYIWLDRELKTCGAFTKTYAFIDKTDSDRCTNNEFFATCKDDVGILTQITRNDIGKILYKVLPNTVEAKDKAFEESCGQEFKPITANDSPNLDYFKKLAQEGMNAPIEKFLKLWYPNRKTDSGQDPYFFNCQTEAYGDFKLVGQEIPADCRPDVLYSWGPDVKLRVMQNALKDGESWKGRPNPGAGIDSGTLFTTIDPVSTFCYGPIQIRVKIKSGTPFHYNSFGGYSGAVGYRTGSYQDFTVADSSIIESWSYGTPEQYDEIVRDIQRISSGQRAIRYEKGAPYGNGISRVLSSIDSHDGSEKALKAALLQQINMILKGEGRIHYAQGTCRNRNKAFQTDHHTYFNP